MNTPPKPVPDSKPVIGVVCSPDVFDIIKRQTGVADLKPGELVGGIPTHVDPKLFNALLRYTDQAKLDQHVLNILAARN